MRRTTELPLLLAPAGGEAAFIAALASGADAIYLGGEAYNARAFAENFDEETLARCIRLAHARGVQVHVTLNTLLTDRELPGAVAWAERLWEIGADAIICADTGLASVLAEHLPKMRLHASTQLSLHSTAGAEEVKDLGFETVVLARELDRNNIASACEKTTATVETFVHGALCVSYSGQCLFSSLVGGRSGNRGACAQPCRLPFDGGYPLSLKDLSLAGHIPTLLETGVACLKIEGRMKSPAYVGGVTKIYRRLLDEKRSATKAEHAELARIFSRTGFTDGYYTKQIETGMTGVRREEDKQDSRMRQEDAYTLTDIPLKAVCRIVAGERARLTLTSPFGTATAAGDIPEPAKSAPLNETNVKERIARMGGTGYTLDPGDIDLTLSEGINLSPAALGALRRTAVEQLTDIGRTPVVPLALGTPTVAFAGERHSALFMRREVWDALGDDDKSLFDIAFVPLWEYAKTKHPPRGIWLPPVIFDDEEAPCMALLWEAKRLGATHALCGNPAQVAYARACGLTIYGDFRLNITNSHAALYWQGHGVRDAVLSPELTAPQMRDIGGRAIVYGRIPLMLTERCYASPDGCANCREKCAQGAWLSDRRGTSFPIMRIPSHRNMVLNSLPTYMGDKKQDIPSGVRAHFVFSFEDAEECHRVIVAWRASDALGQEVRRFAKPPVTGKNKINPKKHGAAPTNSRTRAPKHTKAKRRHI